MTADAYPAAFSKHAHRPGCDGGLFRLRNARVLVDRLGRVGNGGIVTHDYRCNQRYDGCGARVLVTEKALRLIAVAAEERPEARP